ncbi:MAG: hypothetical protein A2Y86_01730 [Candidatus Aminicenantes bacterium RBG_13_62_12]|nr:MAG: hypothetical protein A2Y86_01730 [Candidatus Aminicenantes bacterium RBG_13_62_12]
MSGMMTILIRRMKAVPTGLTTAASGPKTRPVTAPRRSPARIFVGIPDFLSAVKARTATAQARRSACATLIAAAEAGIPSAIAAPDRTAAAAVPASLRIKSSFFFFMGPGLDNS